MIGQTLTHYRVVRGAGRAQGRARVAPEAFAQGEGYGVWLHADVAFEGLREEPGFRELLEPTG